MKLALLPLLLHASAASTSSSSSSKQQQSKRRRCSCLPRSFMLKLDLTKSCSDNQNDMLHKNGGITSVQCHDHDSLIQGPNSSHMPPSHITEINILELGYSNNDNDDSDDTNERGERLLNSATIDDLHVVSGQSFGFDSIISYLSPNSELGDQLEFVPDRLVISMKGPASKEGNSKDGSEEKSGDDSKEEGEEEEIVEIIYELEYQTVYYNEATGLCGESGNENENSETLIAQRGDELGYLTFSYLEETLDRFCPATPKKQEKKKNMKKIRGAVHPLAKNKNKNKNNMNGNNNKNKEINDNNKKKNNKKEINEKIFTTKQNENAKVYI
eukprot:CAMPEP_0183756480 /NCGR_PEP_ID=MMETSP0739-20130205/5062_1 /TAXON_ID=385413 /ORGANISM="Thalassiosira miniscula, Strain CCMP1093" /LENGTH=327 /DNA_ID=CAMNT_0025993681 /DNA_START=11 /DNA_END=994 /DNA_ORIENTATION=+